jgi:hypothetical protein
VDVIDRGSSPLAGFGSNNVGLSSFVIRRLTYSTSGMHKYRGLGSSGDGILYSDT